MANSVLSNAMFTGRNVFVLYLYLATQFLDPLFPCYTKRLLEGSILLRHVLGFLTLFFFIVVIDDYEKDVTSLKTIALVSAGIYLWFIISSKMTPVTWITLLFILSVLYLVDLYQSRQKDLTKKTKEWISYINTGLVSSAIAITAIGTFIYMGEKKLEYKKRFNYFTFFLGKNKCRETATTVSPLKALSAAFK